MASLISSANLIALTDRLGVAWDHVNNRIGESGEETAPVAGTLQEQLLSLMDDVVLGLNEVDQTVDLLTPAKNALYACNRAGMLNTLSPIINAIETHCQRRGAATDSTIISLNTYLQYLNTTRFSALLAPEFSDFWFALKAARLSYKGVYAPAWHPNIVSGVSANGFALRAVGGSFTAGTALDTAKYSEVDLIAEVTVAFADGVAVPTLSLTGVDHTGAAMTWTGSFAVNNPAATISTTLNGALTAGNGKKATVALASGTGIIAGSVLRINSGGPNDEYVVVESISTNDIVTFFRKNHATGEAVICQTPLLLTPGTGGRKCVSISAMTINISSHTAGTVRITGKQPRVMQHGS